jgi:hypothetical protein
MNIFKRAYFFFRDYGISYLYYCAINGVQNLIKYFKVIWGDRNDDHVYLYKILKVKLQYMKNSYERDKHHDMKSPVKQLQFCINCLDRLIKNEYFDPKNTLYNKYGKFIFIDISKTECIMVREKIETEAQQEKCDAEERKEWNIGEYAKQRDKRLVFKTIEKYIEGWCN